MNTEKTDMCISHRQSNARFWMSVVLLLSDLLSLLLAGVLAVSARLAFEQSWRWDLYWQVIPVSGVCLLGYAFTRLYPGNSLGPIEELRRTTLTTTTVIFGLAGLTFFMRNPESYSRLTLGLTWLFALGLVPLGRWFTRWLAAKWGRWGEPVMVVGQGQQTQALVNYMLENLKNGLIPKAVFGGGMDDLPVPDYPIENALENHAQQPGMDTALVLINEVPTEILQALLSQHGRGYQRLILVPQLEGVSSMGVSVFNLNGSFGIAVQDHLRHRGELFVKRVMDLSVVIIGGALLLPLFGVITLCVCLDSKGGCFYGHSRIGKHGRKFRMWKFRTMLQNADLVLTEYLEKYPKLKAEWEADQKLKYDPRITRIGGLLRKYSLDELPQIWNVFKGEMSLVGPRPIVDEESRRYAEKFEFYKQVKPGITGLWQVSGRNDTTYEERVQLDEQYVRSWSIWLDVYILIKTVWVVLRRDGAY